MPETDWVARGIAIHAAAVATFALLWNVYIGLRDRAAVEVRVRHGFFPRGPDIGPVLVLITAVNNGRRPVTLTEWV